ncbi:MAG: TatD family hydrolase [Clostridia bacterium]|nr:TatD family hydrolase [Clostridia bacterium]
MLFDSHAHLDDSKFDADREKVILSMQESGVSYIANIGYDLESSRRSIVLAKRYPFIYAVVGVHPHDVENLTEADILELKELAKSDKVVAIGEIGLDYYYDNSPRDLQKKWFERQIELALELKLPIVIHNRDSNSDCMEILRKYPVKKIGGIMHCYSGSAQMAKEVIDMGLCLSFAGPVTFKNNRRGVEAVAEVPLSKILIETDCPYLAPEPVRGTRNDSRNVKLVAEKVAEIKGISFEEVAKVTTENAKRVYRIK